MDGRHYNNTKLRLMREARELSQEEVGKVLGLHEITIHRIESGKSCSYDALCRYAKLLKCNVTDFLYPVPLAKAV